ncbi:MAG: DUF2726 domain-containing protein [Desulfobacterales bacterium]|nr:DUF2726 domain-containing protein [Desulfobacterales bacterium]MDD4071497.1 DUF2726 domain-containing protein [Desulfobacterales bacterium]MDD4392938.1 DUF2726 domain-containing protein [Desulfobacterales bacterium]
MIDFFWIIIVIVGIYGVFSLLTKKFKKLLGTFLSALTPGDGAFKFKYVKRSALFTPAERSFLKVIDQIVGDDYRVFGKVRLADIIQTESNRSGSQWQTAFNKISGKHVDFVVCDKNTLAVLGAVELDDRSHNLSHRKKRDEFVDQALSSAEIPILHVRTASKYSIQTIKRQMFEGLELKRLVFKPDREVPAGKAITDPPKENFGKCPVCGARLTRRMIDYGKHAGKYILSCTKFPVCKYVTPFKEKPCNDDKPFQLTDLNPGKISGKDSSWDTSDNFKID